LQFSVLGSGSKGNAYLIKEKDTLILIDAGFSLRELLKRLKKISIEINCIKAILITHEHWDHIKGLKNFLKVNPIPVFCSSGTLNSLKFEIKTDVNIIRGGDDFQIGEINISPFSIPHDASEPLGFTFSKGEKKIGFASDLGKVTLLVLEKLKNSNLIAIETNHDEELLKNGPYPMNLKERIRSTFGHLSNKDAIEAVSKLISPSLKYVLPIHLSETNNDPNLVKYYMEEILRVHSSKNILCFISSQREATPLLEV
jgi:phosphoribosyl 1,2-cyclic phosphodiesterase